MSNENSVLTMPFANPAESVLLQGRSNGLALAEGLLVLGLITLLDHTGVLPFEAVPVHPFLFAVILLSAQYGIQGGILAALAAIALSHLDGWPARPIDMTYAQYFRLAWSDSLCWVLAALIVGVVTSHRGRVLKEQTAKLQKATVAESLIAAQYQVLAQRTHQLERSLAGRADILVPDGNSAPPVERQKSSSRAHHLQGSKR